MNSRMNKAVGSIYDTVYVAQMSRDTRSKPQRCVASVYDASQARFSPTETTSKFSSATTLGERNKDSK